MGAVAGAVVQGVGFGVGSAIAHRAVDSIAGPRTVQHEWTDSSAPVAQPAAAPMAAAPMAAIPAASSMVDTCDNAQMRFQNCMRDNNNAFNSCEHLFKMLSNCNKTTQ